MESQLQELAKLGGELQAGFKALKDTQEQLKKDTDSLVQQKLDRIAQDNTQKLEEIQAKQAQLEAAMNRPSKDGKEGEGDSPEAKAEKAAFDAFLRKGERMLTPEQQKALSTDQLDSGGYLVPVQMLGMVNGRIFETSPLRRVANVITTSMKSVEVVLDDQEAAFGWSGEGDAVSTTSTPTIGKIEIVTKKAQAYPQVTQEMVSDSAVDIQAWLVAKIADKIARGENTAFVSGDGVNRPRGFLTYTAGTSTYARGSVEQIVNGSTSAPTETGLIALQAGLKEPYQARAVWGMKRSTLAEIMKLSGPNSFRFLNLQPNPGRRVRVRQRHDASGKACRAHGRRACHRQQRSVHRLRRFQQRLHHRGPRWLNAPSRPVHGAWLHQILRHQAYRRRCDEL
jgi:HK97 family phage major capsid protein